jgi:hypothetical protein
MADLARDFARLGERKIGSGKCFKLTPTDFRLIVIAIKLV